MGFQCFVETEIAHHCGYDHVILQHICGLQVLCQDEHELIAVDNLCTFIHCTTAVAVTIEGQTVIHFLFFHQFNQLAGMCRTDTIIDVRAVRITSDCHCIRLEVTKKIRGERVCGTMCAIKRDLQTFQIRFNCGLEVAHIFLTA